MYRHQPLARDSRFLCAVFVTALVVAFSIALSAAGYHFSGDNMLCAWIPGLGMAPVIRSYGEDVSYAYRGNRRRNEMARQARERRDARLSASA